MTDEQRIPVEAAPIVTETPAQADQGGVGTPAETAPGSPGIG